MKIRHDDKGLILAVGDDACDWPGPVLKLADKDLPADLLTGLGRYVVRKGKLVKGPGAAAAVELPAALRAASKTKPLAALFGRARPATPIKKSATRAKAPAQKTRRSK